jgi:hypothetical protein
MMPRFKLDKHCVELVNYVKFKVESSDANVRDKQKNDLIENVNEMYIAHQKKYEAEDIEVSTAFKGTFIPLEYDVNSILVGAKVENGDNFTNIKPAIDRLLMESKGARNFAVAIWHNHQFSTNLSVADIIFLLKYGCVYETFLDSEKVVVLSMSAQAKEFFRTRNIGDVLKLMSKFREPIAKKQRNVYLQVLKDNISGKISDFERKKRLFEISESVLSEVLHELVNSGAVGIKMSHFDKIEWKESV